MPANSEILNIGNNTSDATSSLISANLDDDIENSEEIVTMYRNKNTRAIGIFILSYDGMIWDKKFEMDLESTDVSDYVVTDLNNDGKNEIVLGYFEDINKRLLIIVNNDNKYDIIYSSKYLAFKITNEETDSSIAISTPFETLNNNKFSILKYDGANISEFASKVYDYDTEIYKIDFGNINDNEKAYVLDTYKDVYFGSSDILKLQNRSLLSIVDKQNKEFFNQEILTSSFDIDNDGIIDINGNEILSNSKSMQGIILNKYYNISDDRNLILLKSVYEDNNANVKIDIKKFPFERIFVDKDNDKNLKLYFIDENKKEWKFLELINVDLNKDLYDTTEYKIILEKNNEGIIGKFEHTNELTRLDQELFDNIYEMFMNDEDTIKFIE